MSQEVTVKIQGGELHYVYSDNTQSLMGLGEARIRRVSSVEPHGTEWTADMAAVDGPVLGPFLTRTEAMAAEVAWLKKEIGL